MTAEWLSFGFFVLTVGMIVLESRAVTQRLHHLQRQIDELKGKQ